MNYTIDPSAKSPAYIQLYEALRNDIVSGVYSAGDRLPSRRVTADRAGVSAVTADHAYSLLCDEGYAASRERSGYYVIYGSGTSGQTLRKSAPSYPNVPVRAPMRSEDLPGSGFPFSVWARTVRQVLSAYDTRILERSPAKGSRELREALSVYLARCRDIDAGPENIIIGSGSENLYERLIMLLGRERIYAVERPSYSRIAAVYAVNGVSFEQLDLGRDGITAEALLASRAEVLHVTPYRSFPSGATATADKRREYLAWADAVPGRYIIEDDVESEFTLLSKPVSPLFSSGGENVIYMNTFSVTLSPALRISYMILPDSLLPEYEEKLGFCSCPVPTFEQLVLAEFIRSGEFERHINRVRRRSRKAPGDE